MRRALIVVLLSFAACSAEVPVRDAPEQLVFSPAELAFGDVPVKGSRAMRLEVENTGQGPVTLRVDEIEGPFEVEPTGLTLEPAESDQLIVRFKPRFQGVEEGKIRFRTGRGVGHTIPLYGRGVEHVLVLDPPHIDFGEVRVGAEAQATFRVRSIADGTLDLRFRQKGSDTFHVDQTPFSLPGRGETTMTVRFVPTSVGGHAAWLEISPCTDCFPVEAHFEGKSAASRMELRPEIIDFGRVPIGYHYQRTASVRNGGTAPGTLDAIRLHTMDEVFTLDLPGEFPITLEPGEAYDFELHFSPEQRTNYEATLIADTIDGKLESQLVASGGGPILAADAVDFGRLPTEVPVRRMVALQNIGFPGHVEIRSVEVSGTEGVFRLISPFEEVESGWEAELEFSSVSGGMKEGLLRIETNLPFQPVIEVPLRGEAVLSTCSFSYFPPLPFNLGMRDLHADTEFWIDIIHVGDGSCMIWSPGFEDPSFEIVNPFEEEYVELLPGESRRIHVWRKREGGTDNLGIGTHFFFSYSRQNLRVRLPLSLFLEPAFPLNFAPAAALSAPAGRSSLGALPIGPRVGWAQLQVEVEEGGDDLTILPSGLPGKGDGFPVLFSPTEEGKRAAWIRVDVSPAQYPHPFYFPLELEATPACTDCDWPSVDCDWRREGDYAIVSTGLDPGEMSCAWMRSAGPLIDWPSNSCDEWGILLSVGMPPTELRFIGTEGSRAATCAFEFEWTPPQD